MRKISAAAVSVLVLGFVLVPSFPARADMEVKGQVRLRSEILDRTDGTLSQYRSYHLLRMRPTFTFTGPSERRFVFEPQFAQALGALNGTTVTSGAPADPVLGIHQAHAILPAGGLEFRIGRQILSYGDELVVGALEWSVVGRSFDALRVRYASESGAGFTDLFASKLAETGVSAESEGDMDFYGLYHSMGLGETAGAFDLYAFRLVDSRGAGRPADFWTFGTRVKSDLGAIDTRVEFTYQTGRYFGDSQTGYQGDLELGIDTFGDGRVHLGGFLASENYRQLFPTAHKWLGTADVFGRRNIAGPRAGVMIPAGKLKTALDLHYFVLADEDAPAFAIDGVTARGSSSASASKSLGTEADLTLSYPADERLTLSGGVSVLFPGAYLRDQFGSDKPVFGFAQVDVRF